MAILGPALKIHKKFPSALGAGQRIFALANVFLLSHVLSNASLPNIVFSLFVCET